MASILQITQCQWTDRVQVLFLHSSHACMIYNACYGNVTMLLLSLAVCGEWEAIHIGQGYMAINILASWATNSQRGGGGGGGGGMVSHPHSALHA